jgi:hypothetical protein
MRDYNPQVVGNGSIIGGEVFMRGSIFLISLTVAASSCSCAANAFAAELVKLPRALYWDLRSGDESLLPRPPIETLSEFGVSELHIWLNDVKMNNDEIKNCSPFSSVGSDSLAYWPTAKLGAFTQALKNAKIKPVYIFSPHIQSQAYIQSLSGPDGPLGIARAQGGVDIEMDLEQNWSESKAVNTCAAGDPATITKNLIDAIRDQATPPAKRRPLKLIASTTSHLAVEFPILLKAADAIAPQLYDSDYALQAQVIENKLRNKWLAFDKPLVPALSVECQPPNNTSGACSPDIFDKGLKTVAGLASCPGTKFDISNYVIWSEVSILQKSSFGQTYMAQTANKLISADCN